MYTIYRMLSDYILWASYKNDFETATYSHSHYYNFFQFDSTLYYIWRWHFHILNVKINLTVFGVFVIKKKNTRAHSRSKIKYCSIPTLIFTRICFTNLHASTIRA